MFSCASSCGITSTYHLLSTDNSAVAIFRKWHAWATENYRFFNDRRSIFGEPGRVPVDGCVRIVDGEGLLFAFTRTNGFVDARIPFDRLTCFKQGETPAYRVSPVGVASWTAVILRVEKVADAKKADNQVAFEKSDLVAEAFPE